MIPDAPTRLGQVVGWIQKFVAYQKVRGEAVGSAQGEQRRRTEMIFANWQTQFTMSVLDETGLKLYIKGGVVNNAINIANSSGLALSGTCWPAVKVTFTIATDGTVTPTAAVFDITKNPSSDDHITIDGTTCYAWVFLAKVTVSAGVATVQQWVVGNFFVIPLGKQKQIWYA